MSIASMEARRSAAKKELDTYVSRKKAVDKIISNIDSQLDDEVKNINKKVASCVSELQDGLKGTRRTGILSGKLEEIKEKNPESDGTMSSCRGDMASESDRCRRMIESLEAEIAQLDRDISAAREAERREAARREAERREAEKNKNQ